MSWAGGSPSTAADCPPSQPGEVCYWGPGTLAWTALGAGYTQFAAMVLADGLAGFYQGLRWPGWQDELAAIGANQGISVFPFLFSAESRPIARASRRLVPFTELLSMYTELERRAAHLPLGSPFRVEITND